MYAFVFALLLAYVYKQCYLFLNNGLYWKIATCCQGLLSQWQCRLVVCFFHNGFWAIMTSKVCFENFYGKAFGTLIWYIGKSTFFKNTKKCYYSYHKNFKITILELCWRQCRQGNYCFYDFFFHCEEALTFFKFKNVY